MIKSWLLITAVCLGIFFIFHNQPKKVRMYTVDHIQMQRDLHMGQAVRSKDSLCKAGMIVDSEWEIVQLSERVVLRPIVEINEDLYYMEDFAE